jgi:hypothetical protein
MSILQNKGQQQELGDNIQTLPVDNNYPTHNEIHMVDTLFKQKHTAVQKILTSSKEFVLLLILFIVFSLPFIDELINKFVMTTDSPYILIGIKGAVFVIIYFLIKNIYLVRV